MANFLSSAGRAASIRTVGLRYLVRCSTQTCSSRDFSDPLISVDRLPVRLYATSADEGVTVPKPKYTMTFAEYRKLKKSLRARARLAGIPMALLGTSLSSAICVHINPRMFEMTPEEIQGWDPIQVAALSGVVSGFLGYLVGSALFSVIWRTIARAKFAELEMRDEDFLQRLQLHRFSGVNKYEDDYYGDKILTLSDYRQWRRQQQKRREAIEAVDNPSTASEKT